MCDGVYRPHTKIQGVVQLCRARKAPSLSSMLPVEDLFRRELWQRAHGVQEGGQTAATEAETQRMRVRLGWDSLIKGGATGL